MARGARGISKDPDGKAAASSAADTSAAPSGPAPVNLGDMAGLKRGMDDCVVAAILESGYEEDFFVSNVKIGLGSLTIVVALLAQFYPKKYPDNWLLLLICLVLYSIGTAFLSVFTTLVEDDSFLITRPRKVAGNLVLRVASMLPRYSHMYTLVLSSRDSHSISLKRLWSRPHRAEDDQNMLTRSITEFYDERGILHEDLLKAEVQSFVARYERGHKKEK